MSEFLPIRINKSYLIQEKDLEYVSTFSYAITTQQETASRNVLPNITNGMVKLHDYNQYITIGQAPTATEVFTSELEFRAYLPPKYNNIEDSFLYGEEKGYATVKVNVETIVEDGVTKVQLVAETFCDNGEYYIDQKKAVPAYSPVEVGFYIYSLGIDNQYTNSGVSYPSLFQTEPPFNLLVNRIVAVSKHATPNWGHVGLQLTDHLILIDNVPFGKTVRKDYVTQTIERRVIT